MAVLFVSHSSRDDAHATALEHWLVSKGFDSLFIDHSNIAGGDKWRDALRAAAHSCRVVVCLVSEHWLASAECFGEFRAAWYQGRRIIPLFLLNNPASLDNDARSRLARVQDEDQGLDLVRCIGADGALVIDSDAEVSDLLVRGLNAAGANNRVGLDPAAFSVDTKVREHPFPGLASFGDEDADAALFYGRSREIAETLVDLRAIRAGGDRRPLVILGASGAGKSSLLKAGIIPRLRRERPAWLPLRAFRPGADPLLNFSEALTRTLGDYEGREAIGVVRDRLMAAWSAAERMEADAAPGAPGRKRIRQLTNVGRAAIVYALEAEGANLRRAANLPAATILISVDQAEELARAESTSGEALADYLRAALTISTSPWQLVFTIRTDSFPELQNHPRFEGLEIRSYDLRSIPVFRFDHVVEEPARRYGVGVDVELIDRLMEDAPREDALPLLAFALQRLWRLYAATGQLSEIHYRNVGGLTGLIEDAATRAMRGMEPESEAALPSGALPKSLDALGAQTFVPALVQINDKGATIRRVARWGMFETEARDLLDRFERWRLIRKSGEGEDASIEVAHEALFREWSLLNAWLEPERARLDALRALQVDAAAWDRSSRDRELLNHRDNRLTDAEDLARRAGFEKQLGKAERAYLTACRSAQRRRESATRRVRALVLLLATGILTAALPYGLKIDVEDFKKDFETINELRGWAFANTGDMAAALSTGPDGSVARVWRLGKRPIQSISATGSQFLLAPNGQHLVVLNDGQAFIYPTSGPSSISHPILDLRTSRKPDANGVTYEPEYYFGKMNFSSDGKWLSAQTPEGDFVVIEVAAPENRATAIKLTYSSPTHVSVAASQRRAEFLVCDDETLHIVSPGLQPLSVAQPVGRSQKDATEAAFCDYTANETVVFRQAQGTLSLRHLLHRALGPAEIVNFPSNKSKDDDDQVALAFVVSSDRSFIYGRRSDGPLAAAALGRSGVTEAEPFVPRTGSIASGRLWPAVLWAPAEGKWFAGTGDDGVLYAWSAGTTAQPDGLRELLKPTTRSERHIFSTTKGSSSALISNGRGILLSADLVSAADPPRTVGRLGGRGYRMAPLADSGGWQVVSSAEVQLIDSGFTTAQSPPILAEIETTIRAHDSSVLWAATDTGLVSFRRVFKLWGLTVWALEWPRILFGFDSSLGITSPDGGRPVSRGGGDGGGGDGGGGE